MEKVYEGRAKGGANAAKIVKQKHINKYLENPNICKYCGKEILPKENERLQDVRAKKFCGRSCSSNYNNKFVRGYTLKSEKIKKEKEFRVDESVPIYTLFGKGSSKYSFIRAKGRAKMNFYKIEKKCVVCGYDIHVEAHHKKPCNAYDENTPLYIVNDLDNLVYLCPNHHYEADNNILIF